MGVNMSVAVVVRLLMRVNVGVGRCKWKSIYVSSFSDLMY